MPHAAQDAEAEGIWKGCEDVWHAWEPGCDTCRLAESETLKKQLLICGGCLVAKYCSKECQRTDWKNAHKNQCHLYEAAKSLGPGTLNDPTLSLKEKLTQWNFLNSGNHVVIAAAALKNDPKFAATKNVGILLSLSQERAGSKYEHRTFFIDRVLLLDREASDAAARSYGWKRGSSSVEECQEAAERTDNKHFKVLVGWCMMPSGDTSGAQMWVIENSAVAKDVLPPGFDLNRYVTHVNRGITHFHGSWIPLPRNVSDVEIESMDMPQGWWDYVARNHFHIEGLKGGQGTAGYIWPDGRREAVYKWDSSGHFRRCAPGETDFDVAEEFKKHLVDPSRMVRLISKHLAIFEDKQRAAAETRTFDRDMTMEEALRKMGQGHRQ
ncbi:BZ3500-MvSof-1268-A1-R1-Chr4-3g07231 protein [Mycena sanguinolenta]|uniref:BZ3500-MvSof-1268-A1-R1-Chr4-3g07231 protein n=1 Tax=Mycena sanguinolenta TaxID=230812 RepID=A0A8H6ZAJ5_9AGAR|nr:BZ3500-MvSof-1268-A1-R1-Chr4-3g07231 protein [Mycena sanguinolenta]